MSTPRQQAVAETRAREPRVVPELSAPYRVAERYGENTFGLDAMRDKLPSSAFKKLQRTVKRGEKLDRAIADAVAHAMKEWALEKGATHFCHWFQPQTGLTAEKHDAFMSFDDQGRVIERFSGSQLIQSEPDASSFPSGGMRSTFEARGYTAWDASSPVFIMEGPNGKTLCVPSVFISYHGHALDLKTPLLRSMETLNKSACRMIELLGRPCERVVPTLGPEQEYFLIDQAFYTLRPDLVASGRTLLGAKPAKGQQLEDHYFGSIKARILAYMQECERELFKLGVPAKTRHNEVAPAQYEMAPIFEEANIAADHNQIVMETLRAVARRHHLALLLHEKPFAGVNGSGKHNNWSMSDDHGANLLEPGKTPSQNLQFLVFLLATMKGVHRRAGLLRASIGVSGNDHRLGANEAPPAIISVFLGEQLTGILNAIEKGKGLEEGGEERLIALGLGKLPEVSRDATDRNRTSPFAFTGNKFEFRAVPSSAVISWPITILNAAVAEALDEMHAAIQKRIGKKTSLTKAVMEVVRESILETKAIRFEGNNYDPAWVKEAAKRGLPNLRKAPEALAELVKGDAPGFFARAGVMSEDEVEARYHVTLERYVKDIQIEADALHNLVRTSVLPAATAHQRALSKSITEAQTALAGGSPKAVNGPAQHRTLQPQVDDLKDCAEAIGDLHGKLAALGRTQEAAEGVPDLAKQARAYADEVLPAMGELRLVCDRLEETVDDALWPLPKYREMLFLI